MLKAVLNLAMVWFSLDSRNKSIFLVKILVFYVEEAEKDKCLNVVR